MTECSHPDAVGIVTTVKVVHPELDENDHVLLVDLDLVRPDTIEVELSCPQCGQWFVPDDKWEII